MTRERTDVVAAVARVTTLADGGIRVSLDLPEDAVQVAAWLMQCKQRGVCVLMEMTVFEAQEVNDSAGWIKTTTMDVRE